MQVWTELTALRADLEAVKANAANAPAPTDLSGVNQALADLSAKVETIVNQLGTPPA